MPRHDGMALIEVPLEGDASESKALKRDTVRV
jgi:hypothetical protein